MPQVERNKQVTRIAQLPNLGPKSAAMLANAGIATLEELREFGAVAAYVAVRRDHACASLNLLYALVAALDDTDWKSVQRERKLELMLAVEDAMENSGRAQHG